MTEAQELVRQYAETAISRRLGYGHPGAVISVDRDPLNPGAVILHVNSGGNSLAAEVALREAGYHVEEAGYDPFAPGHYGVQMRVRPGTGNRGAA